MNSWVLRLLCAGWGQVSHLDKEIPLVSLQMQRTKISDLLPPSFVVRTQPACFCHFHFSGYSSILTEVPSVSSRNQTCHTLVWTQLQWVKQDFRNVGQWGNHASAALHGLPMVPLNVLLPHCALASLGAWARSGCYIKDNIDRVTKGTEIYFSPGLRLGSVRSKQIWCLERTHSHFLNHRWPSSYCVPAWQKRWGNSPGPLL